MDSISADLELADSKKDNISKTLDHSLLLLTHQWKDLEDCFDSTRKSIEQQLEELEAKQKHLGFIQYSIKERFEELESREKQLESTGLSIQEREKQLNLIQESINKRYKEFELKEKDFKERSKELELSEKLLEKRFKQREFKEKQCAEFSKVKVEDEEYHFKNNAICLSSPNLRFTVNMDGKCLQIFLNEHFDKQDSMCDELFRALGMSSDPAKLVLDAMEGFYPPYTKKGNKEFEGSVIRRSCTLLLGQLLKVAPQIRPCVREEAKRMAVDWERKMKVDSENAMEVIGFLQLVASYELISDFGGDKLFKHFVTVVQHREAPSLCQALGFADKVPDFIPNLVRKRQNLAAIRFIYAFKLVEKIPPVPILEDYYKYWKKIADETCKVEDKLSNRQILIAKQSIVALRAVIRCIEDHELQLELLPEDLERCIAVLKEKANCRYTVPLPAPKAEEDQREKFNASSASPPGAAQPRWQSRNKRLRVVVPEDTPNPSVPNASTMHKMHSPHRRSGLFLNQDSPFLSPSSRHYRFAGHAPHDPHMRSYPDRSIPFYPGDVLREPSAYYDGLVPFHYHMDTHWDPGYYEGPLPFVSPRDALIEPDFHDGPVPFHGYNLPPRFPHLSILDNHSFL